EAGRQRPAPCRVLPCGPAAAACVALHVGIVGTAAALWRYPADILGWVLDVAGFAVHAVLRIDLQARAVLVAHDFVNARGAITLRGFIVLRQVELYRRGGIVEQQVTGLVFFVE